MLKAKTPALRVKFPLSRPATAGPLERASHAMSRVYGNRFLNYPCEAMKPVNMNYPDEKWMEHAIHLACEAEKSGEVPVGAVLVRDEILIAEGWNRPIGTHDPSAHAEIVAIRSAGERLGNYRLVDTTLYVTLEPCIMCIGAIMHARIERLVFGASDPIRGAVCSALDLSEMIFFNHRLEWNSGVHAGRCSDLLKDFFARKRNL